MQMDLPGLLTVLSFAVQIAAGIAPMKWPQHAWLAGLIFWLACAIMVGSILWWLASNWEQVVALWEPKTVIAVGITLAAIGLGWQLYRGSDKPKLSQAEALAITAPFQAQIDVLNRQLQALNQPAASKASETPPVAQYTERDVRELLDALTEAHELLEKTIAPAFFGLESAVLNYQGFLRNGANNFARSLTEYRTTIQETVWPRVNDFVYTKHSRYKDEMRFALALEEEAAKGEVTRKLDTAIDAVKRLPQNSTPEMDKLVEPQLKAVASEIQPNVYRWLGKARGRIDEMTKSLRQTGTLRLVKG